MNKKISTLYLSVMLPAIAFAFGESEIQVSYSGEPIPDLKDNASDLVEAGDTVSLHSLQMDVAIGSAGRKLFRMGSGEITDSVSSLRLNKESGLSDKHGFAEINHFPGATEVADDYGPNADRLFPEGWAQTLVRQYCDLSPAGVGEGSVFDWRSGSIVATGATQRFPGLMNVDSGSIGINQSVGNFSFYLGGRVNKYGYLKGVHTQYGVDGSLSYQLASGLSVTAFGEYYFGRPPFMGNGLPMQPAMVGFYARSRFGGYVDYQINEHWGVMTGAQTVQQVGTNIYKTEPIVTPYYRINKKVAIGLPVGQILYHLLKK